MNKVKSSKKITPIKNMSTKSAKRIKNYEVYPKNGVAQAIMYQNMSSHYRRIYNAKPRVDTGPPFSHRPKPHLQPKPNTWDKKEREYYLPKQIESSISLNSSKCSRQGCGESETPTFKPVISKTSAESKLRGLRVYHPPRRRVYSSSDTSLQLIKSSPEVSVPDIPWIRPTRNVKETPSKGSNSDSAYTEEGEGLWSGRESRGPTPVSDTQRVSSLEDLMYAKFVRDITEEVLEKGVFTNKALNKIFQNHIEANKKCLNVRRMKEEVEKLQLELGIPADDSLNKMDYAVSYTSSDEKMSCHKVEDKELMDALSQLNISSSLKADIASSLGLYSTSSSISLSSISSSESLKHSGNNKHATFSSPLEVIYDTSQKGGLRRLKFPQSDDDSYEMLSEGSESRPQTPLGLAW